MNKKYITVIGQDNRTSILYAMLVQNEYNVNRITDKKALASADLYTTVILPIPYTDISGKIKGTDFSFADLACKLTPSNVVILGKADSAFTDVAHRIGFEYTDLNEDIRFKTLNAIPSAEAAVNIASEQYNRTLYGSNVLICGYGCIGKCLAKILNGYGANVTVAARKASDLINAEYNGCKTVNLADIASYVHGCDIIFNTCPAPVLSENVLDNMPQECIIIDLASRPGGCDFEYAAKIGLNAKLCLQLPDKFAPQSSGENLFKVISSMI